MSAWTPHLPQAVVGLVPVFLEEVHQSLLYVPRVGRGRRARLAGQMQSVEHLSPDVELVLVRGPVADPYGRRALITGQPWQLVLGKAPRAVQPVHDLQVCRVSRDRPQEPFAPRASFVDEPAGQERLQREGRVSQPAVSIVPVATASEVLGQRRRRSRDDAAGGSVGEPLERHQGSAYGVLPFTLIGAAGYPTTPELLGLPERPQPVDRRRCGLVRRGVGEHERHPVPGNNLELRPGGAMSAI